MDYSPPDSSVHGVSQARVLDRVAIPSSRESSQHKDQTHVSCIGRQMDSSPRSHLGSPYSHTYKTNVMAAYSQW